MPCSNISAGAISLFAITKGKNELYAWGSQQNGQLGLGETSGLSVPEPTRV